MSITWKINRLKCFALLGYDTSIIRKITANQRTSLFGKTEQTLVTLLAMFLFDCCKRPI